MTHICRGALPHGSMRRTAWLSLAASLLIHGALGAQAEPAKAAVAPADLPPASQLIARHVEALGGESALRARESITLKGTFEAPSMGLTGTVVVHSAAPDKAVVKISVPDIGDIRQGYDGKVGWSDNPMMGPMIVEGEALKAMQEQSDFWAELNYDERYPTMETVERTEFGGKDCFKVRLVDQDAKERFEYFDVETGLLAGSEGGQATPQGEIYVTTVLDEYERFGRILLPTLTTEKMMGMEQLLRITEVEFDNVEPSVFELPASIQVLLEEPGEPPQE